MESCKTVRYNYSSMPNFNGGLAKPPLKLEHRWITTSHINYWDGYLSMSKCNLNHVSKTVPENSTYKAFLKRPRYPVYHAQQIFRRVNTCFHFPNRTLDVIATLFREITLFSISATSVFITWDCSGKIDLWVYYLTLNKPVGMFLAISIHRFLSILFFRNYFLGYFVVQGFLLCRVI